MQWRAKNGQVGKKGAVKSRRKTIAGGEKTVSARQGSLDKMDGPIVNPLTHLDLSAAVEVEVWGGFGW